MSKSEKVSIDDVRLSQNEHNEKISSSFTKLPFSDKYVKKSTISPPSDSSGRDNSNSGHSVSYIENIKENRKFMADVLKRLTNLIDKSKDKDIILKECIKMFDDYCSTYRKITNIEDEEKNTLLHRCVQKEKNEHIKIILKIYELKLLDNHKDELINWIDKRNNDKVQAIDIAAQRSNIEIINLIYTYYEQCNSFIKLTDKESNIFHQSSKKNEIYPIIFFYEKLRQHYPNKNILNFTNNQGMTPLHYASRCGNKNVLEVLIDYGSDINQTDFEGNTVLHHAVRSNDPKIVKKLLIRGVNKNIENSNGLTAFQIAESKNNTEIMTILKEISLYRKFICLDEEISYFKPKEKNYSLLVIIYSLVIIKSLFLAFNIVFIASDEHKLIDVIDCLEKQCIFEQVFYLASYVSDLILFIFVNYFEFCGQTKETKEINKENDLNEDTDLIELAASNPTSNICVKCKSKMESETIHCLVCDKCIEHFDHHCFWLNICIDNKNKKLFEYFFKCVIVVVLLNTMLTAICNYISYVIVFFYNVLRRIQDEYYILVFFSSNKLVTTDRIIMDIFTGLALLLIIYILYFVTGPAIKNCWNKNKNTKISIQEEILSSNNLIDKTTNEQQSFSI